VREERRFQQSFVIADVLRVVCLGKGLHGPDDHRPDIKKVGRFIFLAVKGNRR